MCESTSFADHFSARAVSYSQFRPGYPVELFTYLASLCPAHERVWDCASGSGQAAGHFVGRFDSVIASDASFVQINNANASGEYYRLSCLAERSPFVEHSFDLITVAQALHWFDLERFYNEVKRILKPGGVLAVWSYGLMQITPLLDDIVNHLYADTVGPYWPFERKWVESGYRELDFPFHDLVPPTFTMQADWTLEHLLGYLSTWSAVKRCKQETGEDPLLPIVPQLNAAWSGDQTKRVHWPLSLRVGML